MAKKRTVQEQEVLKDLANQRRIVVAEILLLEKMLKANKDWAVSAEQMKTISMATKKFTAEIHRIHLR